MQRFSAQEAHEIKRFLAQLDPEHLNAYVAASQPINQRSNQRPNQRTVAPMRLGRYAERLMHYFLLHNGGIFELIAANVPLRSDPASGSHTTLGEFDYLLRDAAGNYLHWELAVKFYLYHPAPHAAQPADFKGPAGKDTLALKLDKMFGRQLRHAPPPPYEATEQRVWQPQAYARGWKFYPLGDTKTMCDALNTQHLRGWWAGIDSFAQSNQAPEAVWANLPRLHWLSRYACEGGSALMPHADLVAYLRRLWAQGDARIQASGQMVAQMQRVGEGWAEVARGFVMPTPTL